MQPNAKLNVTESQLQALACFTVEIKGDTEFTTYELNMSDLSVMLKLSEDGVISTDDAAYELVQHGVCYGKAYDGIVHRGKHAVALSEVGSNILAELFGTKDIKSYRALLDPRTQPTTLTR